MLCDQRSSVNGREIGAHKQELIPSLKSHGTVAWSHAAGGPVVSPRQRCLGTFCCCAGVFCVSCFFSPQIPARISRAAVREQGRRAPASAFLHFLGMACVAFSRCSRQLTSNWYQEKVHMLFILSQKLIKCVCHERLGPGDEDEWRFRQLMRFCGRLPTRQVAR
jgi:hypothetical protein